MLPTMLQHSGLFVMRGDFIQQNICFMAECKRIIATGSPWWSHNTGLGANFICSYSDVLGSPFFWPLVLLPTAWLPWVAGLMVIPKFVVASVLAFLAMRVFVSRRGAAIGALLYAFSGYSVINMQFAMFADSIARFPLMIVGIEGIMRRQRYGFCIFAVAVGLSAARGCYSLVAETLFLSLYVAFRVLWDHELRGRVKPVVLRIAGSYMLGVGIAGVLLAPTIAGMWGNPRAGVVHAGTKDWLFFGFYRYLELIRAFLMPSEGLIKHAFYPYTQSWTSTGIHLPLFGMSLVIIHFVRHRNWLAWLIVTCMALSLIPIGSAAFSGFTNLFYTRWWLMLAFLLALATARVFDDLGDIQARSLRRSYLLCVGLCVALTVPFGLMVVSPGLTTKLHGITHLGAFASFGSAAAADAFMGGRSLVYAAWALCAVNYLLLAVVLFRKNGARYAIPAVALAAMLNFGVFIELNNRDMLNTVGKETRPTGLQYHIDRTITHLGFANHSTTCRWRIDYPHEIRNYGLYANYPSPNVFHSIRSGSVAQFAELMGCGSPGGVQFLLPYDRPALRSLLSVKYFVNFDSRGFKTTLPGFTTVRQTGQERTQENRHCIPMGISYDTYVRDSDLPRFHNCVDRLMLRAVVLDERQIARCGTALDELRATAAEVASADWKADADRLARHACSGFVGTSSGFSAWVHRSKPSMVFFSIPWDRGWKATIDGRRAVIEKVNTGFLGVVPPAGRHHISFQYRPPGFGVGLILTLVSLLLLVVTIVRAHGAAPKASRE